MILYLPGLAEAMQWAEQQETDVLVVPELALTGYHLADLVLHEAFIDDADAALAQLAKHAGRTTSIVSTIERAPPQRLWDSRIRRVGIVAKLLCDGEVRGTYQKRLLPTYSVFDEGKYIGPGNDPGAVWRIGDIIVGVSIPTAGGKTPVTATHLRVKEEDYRRISGIPFPSFVRHREQQKGWGTLLPRSRKRRVLTGWPGSTPD